MQMPETPGDFALDGAAVLIVGGFIGMVVLHAEQLGGSNVATPLFWVVGVVGGALLVMAGIAKAVQIGMRSSRD